jgi:uncharacterized protein YebE (UPF0316 family)
MAEGGKRELTEVHKKWFMHRIWMRRGRKGSRVFLEIPTENRNEFEKTKTCKYSHKR